MSGRIRTVIEQQRILSPRNIAIGGAVLALLSLLSNNAGLAIIFASLIIPIRLLVELSRRDLVREEPRWTLPAMLGWGIAVGIVMAVLGSVVAAEWWIDGAALHVGAAGFGGEAADQEGSPGFAVLLFVGIVLPVLGVTVAALGPYYMRRYPIFRNEVMDGVILGAAAGCGLATGTTIVFVWPILGGGSVSGGSVADWTALVLGVLVTRPIIFGLAVSFVCAGVWHVAMTQRTVDLLLPVAIGSGGVIVFGFGDLLVQSNGTRSELFWHVLVAVALLAATRIVLARALAQDRLTRMAGGNKVICSVCGAATPPGQFCAACGSPLNAESINDLSFPSRRDVVDVTDEPAEQADLSVVPVDAQSADDTVDGDVTEPMDALEIETRR